MVDARGSLEEEAVVVVVVNCGMGGSGTSQLSHRQRIVCSKEASFIAIAGAEPLSMFMAAPQAESDCPS